MKAKYVLVVFCGMLLCEALSAQTEEFRFKLYLAVYYTHLTLPTKRIV